MTPETPGFDKGTKRSERIKDDDWQQHRALLCTLYRQYTLEEVRKFMEDRFGFSPTKRQYGYRFEKWGIKKYNAGDKKSSSDGDDDDLDTADQDAVGQFDRYHNAQNPSINDYYDSTFGNISGNTPDIVPKTLSDDSPESTPDSPIQLICYPWGPAGREKLAADLCAAMCDDENAFALYFHLSGQLPIDDARKMLIILCARTAEQTKAAKMARSLLEGCRTPNEPLPFHKEFLYEMLDAHMQERDEFSIEDTSIDRMCDAVEKFARETKMFVHCQTEFKSIDLVTYHFLAHGLAVLEKSQRPSSLPPREHLLNQYVLNQPLARQDFSIGCSPLQDCVRWCRRNLASNPPIPIEVAAIASDNTHLQWRDNIQIFCTLWHAMMQSVGVMDDCIARPFWYEQCESALGISPTELLVTIAWMISDAEAKNSTPSHLYDPRTTVIQRATMGAALMTQWQENKLLKKFLKKFIWMNELIDKPLTEDKDFGDHVLSCVRMYIANNLGVDLPVNGDDTMHDGMDMDLFSSHMPAFNLDTTDALSGFVGLTSEMPMNLPQHSLV